MTAEELSALIHEYRAGLEAELQLLEQLKSLADSQQAATHKHDHDRLADVTDERDRVMASLVTVEHELRPTRHRLAAAREQASQLSEFEQVVTLHRSAAELVTTIMSSDTASKAALEDAELARRMTSRAIEMGETTLAAYRRVIAPALSSAALVDERG